MKELYKSVMAILFFAVAAFFSGGCSSTPSESDAQRELESKIAKESGGLIKLVSFTKTNAILSEVQGVKVYTLEYEATIEFLEDRSWLHRTYGVVPGIGFFRVIQHKPHGREREKKSVKAGQRESITGEIKFEKMEKGWRKTSYVVN